MEPPVSPIPLTRSFFGSDLGDLSDLQIIDQFATENQIGDDVPVTDIIAQMEQVAQERIGNLNSNSQLKNTRLFAGQQAFGLDDNDIIAGYVQEKGLSLDTPVTEVIRLMEDESRARLFEENVSLGDDQVFGLRQLQDSAEYVRENIGFNSLLQEEDLEGAVDQNRVDEFLRPTAARRGLLGELGKAAGGLFLPELVDTAKELGRNFAAGSDPRQKALNRIESRFNTPEHISSFVATVERFKQNPELFSEEDRQNLADAARLLSTTSTFFDTESDTARDFFGGMAESALLSVAKSSNQVLGSIGQNVFDTDGEFTDSILRDLNFTEAVSIDNDPESAATLVGNLAGSTVQTITAMLSGGGVPAMVGLFGMQGAGGNLETYRQVARENGFERSGADELVVGLGGAIISGALGSLSGKAVEQLPFIKNFVQGGQQALIQNATREGLFQLGKQAITGTLKNPQTIKEAVRLYGQFAASSGAVEAFEEVSEEALNEGLLNFQLEEFNTDPDEFIKRLGTSALGGLFGGVFIAPTARRLTKQKFENESTNILGLNTITAASPDEAEAQLTSLLQKESLIRDRFGAIPSSVAQDLANTRQRLMDISAQRIDPDEVSAQARVLGLGDVLNESSLVGTGFDIAADKAAKLDPQDINDRQREAFGTIRNFFLGSDLDLEDPDKVASIISNVYMTPMGSAENGRRAVTTTARTLGDDNVWRKNLVGVYLTNEADNVSAYDEIFHILNDSRSDQEQSSLVNAYNRLYGTELGDYNKDIGTRDRLASRAASIITGKDSLPENADPDNEFVQVIRAMETGQIADVASHLFDQTPETQGEQGLPVTPQQLAQKLTDGSLFRVAAPGADAVMTFQDEAGNLFIYEAIEDSDGNETGRLKPISLNEPPLERLTASNGAALVPFTQVNTEEEIDAKLSELAELASARSRGAADEEIDFALERLRQRREARLNGQNFEQQGGTEPTGRAAAIERLTEELGREPIALLGPARPRTPLRDNVAFMEAIARESEPGQVHTAQPDPVASLFDEETAATLREAGLQQVGDRRLRNQTVVSDALNQEPLQLTEGNRTPSDQRLLPPASPATQIEQAIRQTGPSIQPNVPAAEQFTGPGPQNKVAGLLPRGSSTPPEQRLLPPANLSSDQLMQAGLRQTEANRIAEIRDLQQQKDALQQLLLRAATQESPDVERLRQIASLVQIVEEQVEQQEAATEQATEPEQLIDPADPMSTLSDEDRDIADALLIGRPIEDILEDVGVPDANSGNPIFRVEDGETADRLIAAGVAIGPSAQMGEVIVTQLDENLISLNPDFNSEAEPNVELVAADVTPEQARENFIEAARPKKGVGSRSGSINSVEVIDETGEEVDIFPNKQSAINALVTRFENDNFTDTPGRGSQDVIDIAGREFTINPVRQDLTEVLVDEYGTERSDQIGAVINVLPDGTTKTKLQKAINRTTKEIVRKVTGNSTFSQERLDKSLADLDTAITESFEETGIDRTSVSGRTEQVVPGGDPDTGTTATDTQEADAEETVETEPEIQPTEIDLGDQDNRLAIRRLRKMVRDNRLIRVDDAGRIQFTAKRRDSAEKFGNTLRNLGGVQTDSQTEGKITTVEGILHPLTANDIFQDTEDFAFTTEVDSPFATVNMEGDTPSETDSIRPTFTENVPQQIRSAINNMVQGLKLRSPIHVTMQSDINADVMDASKKTIEGSFSRLENAFKTKKKLAAVVSQYRDDNGRMGFVLGLSDNMNLSDALDLEVLSHELGHIVHKEILNRVDHLEAKAQLLSEHSKFIEDAQSMTIKEFLESQRLPIGAFRTMQGSTIADQMTMAEARMNPRTTRFYNYVTSFEEWVADQTARWIVADKKPEISKAKGRFFKAVEKRLKSLYDRLMKRDIIQPNKTFANWIDSWVTSSQEGDLGDPIGNGAFGGANNPIAENNESLFVVDPYMGSEEIEARETNSFERGINEAVLIARDFTSEWSQIEDAVRRGQDISTLFDTQEDVEAARNYERLYRSALALRDRAAPSESVPTEVIASYSTAPSLFPQTLQDRAQVIWQRFRNSAFNDVRRRVLSPVITRAQVVANDHPELQSVGRLIDLTFASAGRSSNVTPYVDAIVQQITLRTGRMTQVLDPIFRNFGYRNSTVQKLATAATKGNKIGDVLNLVYLGARDKSFLTQEQLDTLYDGTSLNTMIDQVREQMDDLRNWAVGKGILDESDFIEFTDNEDGRQHYVPRVYDRDVVIENFEDFRDGAVGKNLERQYRKARVAEQFEADFGREMTDDEIDAISESEIEAISLTEDDHANIRKISGQIAGNIAYGRTPTLANAFGSQEKYAWVSNKKLDDIIDEVGRNVPPRLKERKLFFVPDSQLFGVEPVNGTNRKINFMNTNIMDVMGQSIEQLVKRGTFSDLYDNGEAFRSAVAELEAKRDEAKENGNTEMVKKINRDLNVMRDLFESIAEIVDLTNVRGGLQDTPVRNALASFSRGATMSVMGLSSVLGIVETGNIPLRAGLENGIPALFKALEITGKKLAKWPGTIFGGTPYTDILEEEMQIAGMMHRVGEDFSSRNRLDPFQENVGGGSGVFGENNQDISTPRRILRNLGSSSEFIEDAFYRVTMLEQITRVSQIAGAHAARNMMRSMVKAFRQGPLNNSRQRELARLGFADNEGNFDSSAFNEYANFFEGLETARRQGTEALSKYAQANSDMFYDQHFRTTTRLVNQMIARPNVVTRTRWGNSKNPVMRMMYRLRSFTHAYREMAARFFTDEAKTLYQDDGLWGLAKFLTRFMPLLMLSMIGIAGRSELSATLHEAAGNTAQADRIRTRHAEQSSAAFLLESFDKTGMMLQTSEAIGAVKGLTYGNSIFSVIGGVNASKVERLFDAGMKSGTSGDPAYLLNNIIDFAPGANTGVWDWMRLDPLTTQKKQKSDMDFYGSVGGSSATWWK